jgi:hypothetical protein
MFFLTLPQKLINLKTAHQIPLTDIHSIGSYRKGKWNYKVRDIDVREIIKIHKTNEKLIIMKQSFIEIINRNNNQLNPPLLPVQQYCCPSSGSSS